MIRCPSCSALVDEASHSCAVCGASIVASPSTPTVVTPETQRPLHLDKQPREQSDRSSSTEGRFIPGTLLAGRYRLVALLGRGGMGEVYRADDTKLGQTVALKFLPDAVARDATVLERFYAEVRIGRQVSHPNVCRLYDLIEIEGYHCLSMEFVDGEDLSSLLSRIGRLPADKAVDIARDLCAGLAAAHDKGVIHRDLKPANIMIDGKGRARIADFGIAALAEEVDGQPFAGTPAYTAPELLAGQPASVRSDLYALGLVLYEACTGKRLFEARSLAELKAMQEKTDAPSLSSSVRDIPVAMERVVLRCLEKNPDARPLSARAAMAALPGGDPLQAAMAAGETPSPAMVAAAGKVGELDVGVAWACLIAALAGLLLIASLASRTTATGRMAPEKSPELLTEKATELLAALGYSERPRDSSSSFDIDRDYLDYVRKHDTSPRRWDQIETARPGPMLFVYRQSPDQLIALRTTMRGFGPSEAGRITADDPPTTMPGMIDVRLDRRGHLVGLHVVPRATAPPVIRHPPDWNVLLASAALKPEALVPVAPRVTAPVDSDQKAAWDATYPEQPGMVFHIEAAAYRGRPVWFDIQGPWVRSDKNELSPAIRVAIWTVLIASCVLWVAIAILVRRNLRLGRGDRQGALRLTGFLLCCTLVAQMLRADHIALAFEEVGLVTNLVAQALLYAAINWLIYISLEPIARRSWPQLLVGWTRLLVGRFRDPLVARDILIGGLGGIALALVLHLAIVVPAWLGLPTPAPRSQVISSLGAFRHLVYFMLWSPYAAVTVAFGTLLALFLDRAIFRNHALALAVLGISLYFGLAVFTGVEEVWSIPGAVFTAIYLLIALRAGLLAAVTSFYVFLVLEATPMTLDMSSWYADRTLATLVLLGGLLVYGFYFSLGAKPVFGSTLQERDA